MDGDIQRRLAGIVPDLLRDDRDYRILGDALRDFHDLCASVTGIRGDGSQNRAGDIFLPSGTAISPEYAAHTVFDTLRTRRFLRGLAGAIRTVRARQPDLAVHVLYAGCGPFATLALPLMHLPEFAAVRWTLLDIQPDSLAAARKLTRAAGFTERVHDFVLADAALYRHAGPPFQVLVTETMQNLLAGEPQVAITLNLAPDLAPNGLLVPERITIAAEVLAPAPETNDTEWELDALEVALAGSPGATELGSVFDLDLAFARRAESRESEARDREIMPRRVALPPYEPGARLRLKTKIIVHGSEILAEGNSPLCIPRVLHAWRENTNAKFMEVSYYVGRNPGPRIRFL